MSRPTIARDTRLSSNAATYTDWVRLAEGSFGVVYKVKQILPTGEKLVAAKQMLAATVAQRADIANEVKAYSSISALPSCSRHVLCLLDYFEDSHHSYLVFPLMDGDIYGFISREWGKEDYSKKVVNMIRDLCDGMYSIHKRGMAHRDFKPANAMYRNIPSTEISGVGSYPVFQITDLGSGCRSRTSQAMAADCATTGWVGTPVFISPELISIFYTRGAVTSTDDYKKCDVWALGATLYYALTQQLPFPYNDETPQAQFLTLITSLTQRDVKRLVSGFGTSALSSTTINEIVNGALRVDAGQRLTMAQIMDKISCIDFDGLMDKNAIKAALTASGISFANTSPSYELCQLLQNKCLFRVKNGGITTLEDYDLGVLASIYMIPKESKTRPELCAEIKNKMLSIDAAQKELVTWKYINLLTYISSYFRDQADYGQIVDKTMLLARISSSQFDKRILTKELIFAQSKIDETIAAGQYVPQQYNWAAYSSLIQTVLLIMDEP